MPNSKKKEKELLNANYFILKNAPVKAREY